MTDGHHPGRGSVPGGPVKPPRNTPNKGTAGQQLPPSRHECGPMGPWYDGRYAFLQAEWRYLNPHPMGTYEHNAWREGYEGAVKQGLKYPSRARRWVNGRINWYYDHERPVVTAVLAALLAALLVCWVR